MKNIFIKEGAYIFKGKKIYELADETEKRSMAIKARFGGVVSKILANIGDKISIG